MTEERCAWLAALGATTVALDASDKGAGLYAGMGFADAGAVRCLVPPPGGVPAPARPATPLAEGDLADVIALDAHCFGASREALLRRLRAEGAPAFVARAADGTLDGYAFVLPNDGTIGPSAARDEEALVALLAAALAAEPVDGGRLLVPPESGHAATLERLGWVETRRLVHMRRPGGPLPGRAAPAGVGRVVRGRVIGRPSAVRRLPLGDDDAGSPARGSSAVRQRDR